MYRFLHYNRLIKIVKRYYHPKHKAEDEYLLIIKLYCGKRGCFMIGESGHSRQTDVVHRYYKCVGAKKRKDCDKKNVKTEWSENTVIEQIKLEHRRRLIDSFINAIFLYDDRMVLIFNYKDGTRTISFDELRSSPLGSDLLFYSDIEILN